MLNELGRFCKNFNKLQAGSQRKESRMQDKKSSVNLGGVYSQLRSTYSEKLCVAYDNTPSYLAKIIGCNNDDDEGIIMIRMEEASRMHQLKSPTKINIKSSVDAVVDTSLIGSPLRDNCSVDIIDEVSFSNMKMLFATPWSPDEEYHQGIAVAKAREIVSRYEFQHGDYPSGSNPPFGSVWILCDGNDSDDTLLIQYEFNETHFSRGIIIFMDIVPSNEVYKQTLLRKHCALMPPGIGVKTTIENTYRFKSNIYLRYSWWTTADVLSLVEINSNCDVILVQKLHYSDSNMQMKLFLNRLRMLMMIRDDIVAFKKIEKSGNQAEVLYRCGCENIDMEETRENIYKVMTDISGGLDYENNNELDTNLEAVVKRTHNRNLCDLTDKLWDILSRCSSYKDLKMGFNIVFQCAVRNIIVNTPTNKNRLAELITQVSNKRLAIPCLSGSEPLELLLEIGLERLYKDYEHILHGSQICSAVNLKTICESCTEQNIEGVRKSIHIRSEAGGNRSTRKTFITKNYNPLEDDVVGFKNSSFHQQEVAVQLTRLWQIHCTLEHLLLTHQHIDLRPEVYAYLCDQLLKKSINLVDCIDDTITNEVEMIISPLDVREQLKGKDPYTRRIILESRTHFREVNSIFYYSMENIFPPEITASCIAEDKEIRKDDIYYSWLYHKIKTLK